MKYANRMRQWVLEKWTELVDFLKRKQKEKLTVMLIPHSEKRIVNFHISVLSISIIVGVFAIFVVISTIQIIRKSGTKHEVRELRLSNTDYIRQREKIRSEVRPLHQIITEFTTITGQLLENAGGQAYIEQANLDEDLSFLDEPSEAEKTSESDRAAEGEIAKEPGKPAEDSPENSDPYYLPPEITLLKRDIHNLELTQDWGSKTIDLLKKQKVIIKHTPSIWPIRGFIINPYGPYIDQYTGKKDYNPGLDIGGLPGSPVRGTADGIISRVEEDSRYGYIVEVRHRWGFKTFYGNLERITVKAEQKISKGDIIGYIGRSGQASEYQVHYEIWVGTSPQDPFPFLNHILD